MRYDKNKFFRFLKTSAFSDLSWQRVYQIWIKLSIATIVTTVVGWGTTWIFNVAAFQTFLLVIFSFAFPIVLYLITEIVFGRRFAKLSSSWPRSNTRAGLHYAAEEAPCNRAPSLVSGKMRLKK